MPMPGWKAALGPWADAYQQLVLDIDDHCDGLTVDQLRELLDHTMRPTATNCSWATYRVADVVRSSVREALHRKLNQS